MLNGLVRVDREVAIVSWREMAREYCRVSVDLFLQPALTCDLNIRLSISIEEVYTLVGTAGHKRGAWFNATCYPGVYPQEFDLFSLFGGLFPILRH